jgi:hypothetical protein
MVDTFEAAVDGTEIPHSKSFPDLMATEGFEKKPGQRLKKNKSDK